MIQQHSHFVLALLAIVVLYFAGWAAIKLHYFDTTLAEAQNDGTRSYFYHYRCRDGAAFTAVLPEQKGSIRVVVEHMPQDDNTFVLPHVSSEHGRRYSRGGMTLDGQGEYITFTYFGTTTYCDPDITTNQEPYNFGS